MSAITYSVFTKPWKKESVDELGMKLSSMGFDGVEFALRDGYQLEPKDAAAGLKILASKLGAYGLKITSVASGLTESVFAGAASAQIPIIRIMAPGSADKSFSKTYGETKKSLDAALPLCEKYGVKIGVQHHYGFGANNSMELFELIRGYDPRFVGAIWDAAHSGLAGEEPEQALDILSSHLCLVNFKNAFYQAVTGPEAEKTVWRHHFTTGNRGLADWERIVKALKARNYSGAVCLTAEYTDEANVDQYAAWDIQYVKSLFAR